MRMPIHDSLKVARGVINKVNLPKDIAKQCRILSWSNGREQGLSVQRFTRDWDKSKQLVIARQRNSDDILIVCGDMGQFDIQTNQPSDKLWNTNGARVYFRYDQQDKAVRYIEKFLRD